MIDIFIRTQASNNYLRHMMFNCTDARWGYEPVILHINNGDILSIREMRLQAEHEANSDPYIFTDDDVLIVGKDWVKRGVEAMLAHPEYAIVSCLSLVEGENLAVPGYISGDKSEEGMDIYPMHSVGQPMFIRKGVIKEDLPELTLDQECGQIHRYILDKGYKEGLFNPKLKIRSNHLGHGFSSNPILCWGY